MNRILVVVVLLLLAVVAAGCSGRQEPFRVALLRVS